jgi:hypothetical protein
VSVTTKLAPKPARIGAALASVVVFHLALCARFAPPGVLFSKEPVMISGYALQAHQVDRVFRAFHHWGRLWAWDPLVLAGQPAGVAEPLSSKAIELFVIGLRALRVDGGFAFNLFIVLGFVLLPAAAWAAARLFDLSRRVAVIVTLLWVLLWFFDSFMHWCWWTGMISWSMAAYGAVVLVGLLHQAFESKRAIWYLPIGLLAAVLALVDPSIAITLMLPCVALYARAFRSLPRANHGWLALAVLGALATLLVWIAPALRFRQWADQADTLFNATAGYFFFDFFDVLRDADHTGAPVRTIVRSLCFLAAGISLWRWHRKGDRRVLPLASLVVWGLLLAYLGGYSHLTRQTQPYRQIAPAMLAAALPAASLLTEIASPAALRTLDARGRALAAIAVCLIVPRFARTVAYFFPEWVPVTVLNPMLQDDPPPWDTRLAVDDEAPRAVRQWLLDNSRGRGRIVMQPWAVEEYLATTTDLPLFGGVGHHNGLLRDARIFLRAKDGNVSTAELRDYLTTYAVDLVVVVGDRLSLENQRELLEPVATVAEHRIYRTKTEPGWLLRGKGRVAEQKLNSVTVEGASGDEVVLRFHWLDSLRCRPDCDVKRFHVPGDRAGFIRVPSPPPSFEIYNAY